MDADKAGALDDDRFDDELWIVLTDLISTPDQAKEFPEPIWIYLASRWIEWEVGNGGFAQAAFNIPEWFPLAAEAYKKLGLNEASQLILEAEKLMRSGDKRDGNFTASDIGDLFQQFSESDIAKLDSRLDQVGWWADEIRLAYVRKNRDAFYTTE